MKNFVFSRFSRKKYLLVLFSFLSIPFLVKAQATQITQATHTPQPDSVIKMIPFTGEYHTFYAYSIGGKLATNEEIKARLLGYQPSADEFHKANTNLTWGFALVGAAAISGTAAVISFAHNSKGATETTGLVNGSPGFIQHPHSLTGSYLLSGAAVVFLVTSIINFSHAGRHSRKAISLYNIQFQ